MAIINISISYNTEGETLQDALKPFLSCGTIDANDLRHKYEQMPITEDEVNAPVEAEEPAPQPKAEPAPEIKAEAKSEAEAEKAPSKTDIRAMATALSKKDKAKLKEIFATFNAAKLSDIPESEYPLLMKNLVAANA